MSEGRYRCTRCGRSEVAAKRDGCTSPTACPMELRSWWDRLMYRWFGAT